jgi:cyclic-di-GMP-binding protein
VPTFDIVSQVDLQEVRNALDQAQREIGTRFDFKDTGSTLELDAAHHAITASSNTEQKLDALVGVLSEKLVKRKVSLKVLDRGRVEEAAKGTVRQTIGLTVGINDEKAREINKFVKGLNLKGVQSSVQGDQLRVSGKKRDDLQAAIRELREHDFGIPLQFVNMRD